MIPGSIEAILADIRDCYKRLDAMRKQIDDALASIQPHLPSASR